MSEIRFKRDTSFRKGFFTPDSFAHPAKMDAQLLIWIVEKYTDVGETILDPMAGQGTTMLACTLGRDVVLVELEEKFCKMMRDNWEEVKMRPQLGYAVGSCQIIQGDARNLGGLFVDTIVTSPPYSDISMGGGLNTKPPREGTKDQAGRNMSPSQAGAGKYDKIITSPPYEGSVSDDKEGPGAGGNEAKYGRWAKGTAKKQSYTQHAEPVDSIITSPPYEGAMDGGSRHTKGGIPERDKAMKRIGSYDTTNKANIGNLYKDTYLEAMAQVYAQCFSVLKPSGLMILVTKNFIRNKTVIRLDTDTIKLCEQAGFKFLERHYRKLPSQSFWRIIYHKKYPDVEQINYEDVLVFSKVIR